MFCMWLEFVCCWVSEVMFNYDWRRFWELLYRFLWWLCVLCCRLDVLVNFWEMLLVVGSCCYMLRIYVINGWCCFCCCVVEFVWVRFYCLIMEVDRCWDCNFFFLLFEILVLGFLFEGLVGWDSGWCVFLVFLVVVDGEYWIFGSELFLMFELLFCKLGLKCVVC